MLSTRRILHRNSELALKRRLQRLPASTAILLLLLAVVGLSIFARTAKFLPKSDPAHYVEKVSKMDRARPLLSPNPNRATFRPVLGLALRVPTPGFIGEDDTEFSSAKQICFLSLDRHRSPPSLS